MPALRPYCHPPYKRGPSNYEFRMRKLRQTLQSRALNVSARLKTLNDNDREVVEMAVNLKERENAGKFLWINNAIDELQNCSAKLDAGITRDRVAELVRARDVIVEASKEVGEAHRPQNAWEDAQGLDLYGGIHLPTGLDNVEIQPQDRENPLPTPQQVAMAARTRKCMIDMIESLSKPFWPRRPPASTNRPSPYKQGGYVPETDITYRVDKHLPVVTVKKPLARRVIARKVEPASKTTASGAKGKNGPKRSANRKPLDTPKFKTTPTELLASRIAADTARNKPRTSPKNLVVARAPPKDPDSDRAPARTSPKAPVLKDMATHLPPKPPKMLPKDHVLDENEQGQPLHSSSSAHSLLAAHHDETSQPAHAGAKHLTPHPAGKSKKLDVKQTDSKVDLSDGGHGFLRSSSSAHGLLHHEDDGKSASPVATLKSPKLAEKPKSPDVKGTKSQESSESQSGFVHSSSSGHGISHHDKDGEQALSPSSLRPAGKPKQHQADHLDVTDKHDGVVHSSSSAHEIPHHENDDDDVELIIPSSPSKDGGAVSSVALLLSPQPGGKQKLLDPNQADSKDSHGGFLYSSSSTHGLLRHMAQSEHTSDLNMRSPIARHMAQSEHDAVQGSRSPSPAQPKRAGPKKSKKRTADQMDTHEEHGHNGHPNSSSSSVHGPPPYGSSTLLLTSRSVGKNISLQDSPSGASVHSKEQHSMENLLISRSKRGQEEAVNIAPRDQVSWLDTHEQHGHGGHPNSSFTSAYGPAPHARSADTGNFEADREEVPPVSATSTYSTSPTSVEVPLQPEVIPGGEPVALSLDLSAVTESPAPLTDIPIGVPASAQPRLPPSDPTTEVLVSDQPPLATPLVEPGVSEVPLDGNDQEVPSPLLPVLEVLTDINVDSLAAPAPED